MANARSLVLTAGGKTQEAADADVQLVSGTVQNGTGSLTINAAATSTVIKVAGATVLTVAAALITAGQPLSMGSNKITNLGTPTAASSDGATAAYAEAQKTGGPGPTFYLNTGQSFVANGYVGLAGDGASTLSQNITPWIAPCAGTLKNLRVFGFANTSGTVNIYLYKATAALSPVYAATTLKAVLTNTFTGNDTTHSVSVSAGDLYVAFSDAAWSANGASVTSQFIPTSA